MAEQKKEAWRYKHPTDHPDNKPPLTTVAKASEEAVAHYEEMMNRGLEKSQPPKEEAEEAGIGAKPASGSANEENLEECTVPELKDIAYGKGIHVPSDATKADIIKAIKKGK